MNSFYGENELEATGSYIHISAYAALYALYGFTFEGFVTVSGRVLIFSQSDAEPWSIYAGVPARRIKERSMDLLKLEKEFPDSLRK